MIFILSLPKDSPFASIPIEVAPIEHLGKNQ